MEEKLLKNQEEKGNPLTEEQTKEIDRLMEQGQNEAALDFVKKCLKENRTDETKERISRGLVEDIGIELDEES